jgi:dephospho-CoA kinase
MKTVSGVDLPFDGGIHMKILIIVGMPAAGKNIARIYAEERGLPYFATGDLVREEVGRRGIERTPENMARLSTELRGEDGMGVTRLALISAMKTGAPVVMLEGMRSWPEVELIRKNAPSVVVAFVAPLPLRRERIISRGRSDDSVTAFEERDGREISYGTATPIALADEYILNTGTLEEALETMNAIVRKYI